MVIDKTILRIFLLLFLQLQKIDAIKTYNIFMDPDPTATNDDWLDNWKPTFETHLGLHVSQRLGAPVSFKLWYFDGSIPLNDLMENGAIDFYFGAPSATACIQSQTFGVPIATIFRFLPAGQGIINSFGGAIVTLADNHKISKLEDVNGTVIGFSQCDAWAAGLLQKWTLERSGLYMFRDAKQLVSGSFSTPFTQYQILLALLSGKIDVGMVRSDNIPRFNALGLINSSQFKVLGAVTPIIPITQEPYPFPTSSDLFPEWGFIAFPSVPSDVSLAVASALMQINSTSYAAQQANYAGWGMPLSYEGVTQVLQDSSFYNVDSQRRRTCVNFEPTFTEYDLVTCPDGYFKVQEDVATHNCVAAGLPCPAGVNCWCAPCKFAHEFEVEIRAGADGLANSSVGSVTCSKMEVCVVVAQGTPMQLQIVNNKLQGGLNFTFKLRSLGMQLMVEQQGSLMGSVETPWIYSASITINKTGLVLLELPVPDSPILLSVVARNCSPGMKADDVGICTCSDGYVFVSGRCQPLHTILLGVCIALFCGISILLGITVCKPKPIDAQEERLLCRMARRLRARLALTKSGGFLLSSERAPPWRRQRSFCVIQEAHMDAATRLALLREDVDVRLLDAFCASLQGTKAAGRLNKWLLDVAEVLLDPFDTPTAPRGSSAFASGVPADVGLVPRLFAGARIARVFAGGDGDFTSAWGAWVKASSQEERFGYFLRRLARLQYLYEDDMLLFRGLKGIADGYMTRLAEACAARFAALAAEPRGAELIALVAAATDFQTPTSRLSLGDDSFGRVASGSWDSIAVPEGAVLDGCGFPNQNIGRLIRGKQVGAIRVSEVDLVEAGMQTRSHPLRRPYTALALPVAASVSPPLRCASSPAGPMSFQPPKQSPSNQPARLLPVAPPSKDYTANEWGVVSSATGAVEDRAVVVQLDEETFLSQLALRARLLNSEFHEKVCEVLLAHGTALEDSIDPTDEACKTAIEPHRPGGSRRSSRRRSGGSRVQQIECLFDDGRSALVDVACGPPKRVSRMREKLAKYRPPHPKAVWPLSANILDPVRLSIVCNSASEIVQVQSWFSELGADEGLRVVRVKNRFAMPASEVQDGYRDLKLSLLFAGSQGLRIIGEVQIHDRQLHKLKAKMHKLYALKRATTPVALHPD